MKIDNKNLVENLRDNKVFKNSERANNFDVGKFGRNINWNHIDSILNLNQKYYDSIHVDMDHNNSNKPIPADLTNIVSIHDSDYIPAIENILASLVHSLVQASLIFTYGSAIEPPSSPHDSLEESVTPK